MKNFVTYLAVFLFLNSYSIAAPIVELAAPKTSSGQEVYFYEPQQQPKQPAAETQKPQQTADKNSSATAKPTTKTEVKNSTQTKKSSQTTNKKTTKATAKSRTKTNVKTNKTTVKEPVKSTKKESPKTQSGQITINTTKSEQPVKISSGAIPAYNYNNVSKMLEYGYYQGAENVLKQELRKNPQNIDAAALNTILLTKLGRLDEAQNKVEDLLKKYPENSDLHYAKGLINYEQANSSNMVYRVNSDVLIENARNEFEKASVLNPKSAKALNALGVIELTNGNIASAKKYFQSALNIDENYANAIDNLGTIDLVEGNLEDAEAKFEKALSINKKGVLPLYHLAQVSFRRYNFQTTLKYIDEGLFKSHNAPYLLNLAGKTYYIQGNEAAAIEAYKKSIASKPEFLASYIDLADIYNRRGDYEFAAAQLKTALSINPDAYDVKLKIADISYTNGKYDQAINFYRHLVGISNYNDKGLKGLANSYFAKAQTVSGKSAIATNSDVYKTLEYINKAIDANGNDLELYLAKLKLTRLTNQPKQSRMILENIVKCEGDKLIDYVVKGEAYLTLYDYKHANEQFMMAVKKSDNLKDDLQLAEIFIYHKQFEPAEIVLDKIITNNPGHIEALNDLDYIKKCKKYSVNYNQSAQNFAKSHNTSAAIEYFQRSLAINPDNAKAHLQLAELYDKQKDYLEALNNYRAYIGLTPENKKNSRKIKKIVKRIRKIDKMFL